MSEEDNKRTNMELQMAVLHTLSFHGRQESLEEVFATEALPETIRVAARGMRGLVLSQKGENSEAAEILKNLDLDCLHGADRRWLFLKLGEVGMEEVISLPPPQYPDLPKILRDSDKHEINSAFLYLYDDLRSFFLRDETGFPWFETMMMNWPEPARSLVTAIGQLARLWTSLIRGESRHASPLATVRDVVASLDLRRDCFRGLENNDNYTFSLYKIVPPTIQPGLVVRRIMR